MLLCLHLVLTSGCKKHEETKSEAPSQAVQANAITAPKAKFNSKSAGYTNWWLEWSKDLMVGGYQRAGKKDPK